MIKTEISSRFVTLTIISIILLVVLLIWFKKDNSKEDLSYSFGFPTHGSYNYGGGPLRGTRPSLIRYPGWNTYYNPFMWNYYRRPYFYY